MTDLHLVGLPRTGSSFSLYYFTGVLRYQGLDFIDLFEPSNPRLKFIPKEIGYSVAGFEPPDTDMTVKNLLNMQIYDSYSDRHRLIKHCFTPPCEQLMDHMLCGSDLTWIEITRDPFERYLSWVIARQSGVWVTTKQERMDAFKRELQPFHSPIDELLQEMERLKIYNQFRQKLLDRCQPMGVIDYNSLFEDCMGLVDRVLAHYNMEDLSADVVSMAELELEPHLLPKKSLTLEEKKLIVTNWQEIQDMIGYYND